MLPRWHDLHILAESNRESTREWERIYILLASIRQEEQGIVRFGAWLEKVGARLQARYAKKPNVEVSMPSNSDVSMQNC
jgi:hypothetical protein